ncbi:hypothetical protein D3C78_925450 [compost metagenome]
MQGFQIVNIDTFSVAFTEFGQQTLGFLLLAKTLFQLVQAHTQRLNLLCQMALVDTVTQKFTRDFPRIASRQRAVDRGNQLVSLFKLAVRSLRHAHFLIERE